MDKKGTQDRIIKAIKDNGHEYKRLSNSGGWINHVRVEGFGDIWPTTGTAQLLTGEWIRKDSDKVVGKLRKVPGKGKEGTTKTDEQRITDLEKVVEVLTRNLEEINEAMKI